MKPKWQKLASLAQEIGALWSQFFGAVFTSKGYPFKNILGQNVNIFLSESSRAAYQIKGDGA